MQVGDGDALPAGKPGAVYLLRTAGNIAHEILDVTNPVQPRFLNEVVRVSGTPHTHKSIPAATDKTRAPAPDNYENGIGPIIHTDNVELDERGTYLYAVDRANTGLHALELTGEAKRIAEGPRDA